MFQETQNSLSLVQGVAVPSGVVTPGSEVATSDTATDHLTPKNFETCLFILRLIPSEAKALPLFLKHQNPNDGWIRLAAHRVLASLYSTFGLALRSRKNHDLISMAQILCFNTSKKWVEDEPDAEKWIASMCGRNMRWECVGILFTYCMASLSNLGPQSLQQLPEQITMASLTSRPGALASLPDNRMVLMSENSRKDAIMFKEAAQLCADICRDSVQNSLLLYIGLKTAILESMQFGDASPSFWRKW